MFLGKPYPTIGAFYTAIQAAFKKLEPADFTGANQQSNGVGNGEFPINNLADVSKAITMIKEEGEGTASSPCEEGAPRATTRALPTTRDSVRS
jgi:hypothetical protein